MFFSFAPLVVSVGELRQKMIELHTVKTKNGNVEVETTLSKKLDVELLALRLSVGHVGVELQTLVQNQSKLAPKNM